MQPPLFLLFDPYQTGENFHYLCFRAVTLINIVHEGATFYPVAAISTITSNAFAFAVWSCILNKLDEKFVAPKVIRDIDRDLSSV